MSKYSFTFATVLLMLSLAQSTQAVTFRARDEQGNPIASYYDSTARTVTIPVKKNYTEHIGALGVNLLLFGIMKKIWELNEHDGMARFVSTCGMVYLGLGFVYRLIEGPSTVNDIVVEYERDIDHVIVNVGIN